jgi:hypothetical protein
MCPSWALHGQSAAGAAGHRFICMAWEGPWMTVRACLTYTVRRKSLA